MLRWLFRLGFAGALVAGAVWLWSQMNQDIEDEELEDEIPIEFEVPLDPEENVSQLSSASGDTGVGPGANFASENVALDEPFGSVESRIADLEDELTAEPIAATTAEISGVAEATAVEDQEAEANVDDENEGGADSDEEMQQNAQSDLQQLSGIGPVLESRLIEAGVGSIADLAAKTSEELQELGFSAAQAEGWIPQALEKLGMAAS